VWAEGWAAYLPLEVRLRLAREEDLEFVLALGANQAVEQWLAPRGDEQEAQLRELLALESLGLFVIEAGGERVGALSLTLISERSRLCQLNRLMLAPEHRGQGIATAAVRLACRLAVVEHGLHRVQAEVYGDNEASQRLFERVGFVREGVKRRAYWAREGWRDGVLYGLLAEDLPGETPPASG
jgi:RimJ/RimL family protein N-acetyltransferase